MNESSNLQSKENTSPEDLNQEKSKSAKEDYEQAITCEVCDKGFSSRQAKQVHVKTIHEGKKFPCTICGAQLSSVGAKTTHERGHKDKRKLKCDKCSKSFHGRQALLDHVKTHKKKKNTFVCEKCGRSFTRSNDLQRHIDNFHQENDKQACTICGKIYTKKYLSVHEKNVHSQHKLYHCAKCQKTFRFPNSCRVHESTCKG